MSSTAPIVIYGNSAEIAHAARLLHGADRFCDCNVRCAESWHCLQEALTTESPALLVVLADGAAGMEGVYLARQIMPELPVFWFSDDSQFGMQSHRLDCSYFSTKPLTDMKLRKALEHCAKLGIRL